MFDTILAIQRGQGQGLRDWVMKVERSNDIFV